MRSQKTYWPLSWVKSETSRQNECATNTIVCQRVSRGQVYRQYNKNTTTYKSHLMIAITAKQQKKRKTTKNLSTCVHCTVVDVRMYDTANTQTFSKSFFHWKRRVTVRRNHVMKKKCNISALLLSMQTMRLLHNMWISNSIYSCVLYDRVKVICVFLLIFRMWSTAKWNESKSFRISWFMIIHISVTRKWQKRVSLNSSLFFR